MDELVFLISCYLLLLAVPRWLLPRVGWIGVGVYGVVVFPCVLSLSSGDGATMIKKNETHVEKKWITKKMAFCIFAWVKTAVSSS